jgi:hypothetical protein
LVQQLKDHGQLNPALSERLTEATLQRDRPIVMRSWPSRRSRCCGREWRKPRRRSRGQHFVDGFEFVGTIQSGRGRLYSIPPGIDSDLHDGRWNNVSPLSVPELPGYQ